MTRPERESLAGLLDDDSIRLGLTASDRFDAVTQCGQALVATGAVAEAYVESMLKRERSVSTYIGEGVAIPHGTLAGKDSVSRPAMVVLGFTDGVDWGDGHIARVCVGIAAPAGGHVALVARLAEILLDAELAERLRSATTAEQIKVLFAAGDDRGER
ncbi:PTS sugar transporter subunit IIA [Amnibacterium flavum]|uniref:Mannitol-specific phosphotransferase enzyme IIA component n=1 Tax=Amnibacterium flavum TaxID=2173173 RepID=A0A2V1HVK2_9MICO|nr:PTS sugar transporter subunit IIA [Amnibacterium flavum]PVZ94387.1 PTS sugar transporter subunit IIA [Amnibacterium flavum]